MDLTGTFILGIQVQVGSVPKRYTCTVIPHRNRYILHPNDSVQPQRYTGTDIPHRYRSIGHPGGSVKPQQCTGTDIPHLYRYIGHPGGSIQPQQYTGTDRFHRYVFFGIQVQGGSVQASTVHMYRYIPQVKENCRHPGGAVKPQQCTGTDIPHGYRYIGHPKVQLYLSCTDTLRILVVLYIINSTQVEIDLTGTGM